MTFVEFLIIGVGLSMDAFAVSICKGLAVKDLKVKQQCITGLYFGGFQALMPLIGYLLGGGFKGFIEQVDHWIAFILLAIIGGKMILESREEAKAGTADFSPKEMTTLAVATSIDALVVGVTFAFLDVNIVEGISIIGITTFILSAIGVKIGHTFGTKYKSKAEVVGGVVLILMGLKILLEHTGIIHF